MPDNSKHQLNFDQVFCIQSINHADDFTPYLIVFLYIFSVISKWDQEFCLAENHSKQKCLSYESVWYECGKWMW